MLVDLNNAYRVSWVAWVTWGTGETWITLQRKNSEFPQHCLISCIIQDPQQQRQEGWLLEVSVAI